MLGGVDIFFSEIALFDALHYVVTGMRTIGANGSSEDHYLSE